MVFVAWTFCSLKQSSEPMGGHCQGLPCPLEQLSQQRWSRSWHHDPALAERIVTVALTAVLCQHRGVSCNLLQRSRLWAEPRGHAESSPQLWWHPKVNRRRCPPSLGDLSPQEPTPVPASVLVSQALGHAGPNKPLGASGPPRAKLS